MPVTANILSSQIINMPLGDDAGPYTVRFTIRCQDTDTGATGRLDPEVTVPGSNDPLLRSSVTAGVADTAARAALVKFVDALKAELASG